MVLFHTTKCVIWKILDLVLFHTTKSVIWKILDLVLFHTTKSDMDNIRFGTFPECIKTIEHCCRNAGKETEGQDRQDR